MRISDWSSDVCSSDLSGDDSSGIQPDLPTRRETGLFPSAFVPIWTCRSGNEARSGACVKENGMTDFTNLSFQPDDEPPRISTGSEGLDDILGGGLDPNRMYLSEGSPGSGKTTIALQFLLDGRPDEPTVGKGGVSKLEYRRPPND